MNRNGHFDGCWVLRDGYSSIAYEQLMPMQWLQAFFISGDEVIDGTGNTISLRRRGKQVLLEGGVLTKSCDFLSRQGKTGILPRLGTPSSTPSSFLSSASSVGINSHPGPDPFSTAPRMRIRSQIEKRVALSDSRNSSGLSFMVEISALPVIYDSTSS